jgi:hypothetical protein
MKTMGEIVPFRIRTRPRANAEPRGPARILFFLGVRYVRRDDEAGGPERRKPKSAAPRRTRRKKRA